MTNKFEKPESDPALNSSEQSDRPQEAVELIDRVSYLIAQVSETYKELKKWEFLLNYPDDGKESALKDLRPQIRETINSIYSQAKEMDTSLREELEKTLKELENRGFGFIADQARASVSVIGSQEK